jgi:hypothetical protein
MNLRDKVVIKYRDTNYAWVDATDGVLQLDITRGIPQYFGMWSQSEPGQLRLRSRNINLDPGRNAEIALYSQIRVEIEGEPVFTGKIFNTSTEYAPREESVVTIDAFDELGYLSQIKYGNTSVIPHDYNGKKIINPINFATFLQSGKYTGPKQAGFTNGEAISIYNDKLYTSDYSEQTIGGPMYSLLYSSDTAKYPLTGYVLSGSGGNALDIYDSRTPPAGESSDSLWTLPDWDAVIVSNPDNSGVSSSPRCYGSTTFWPLLATTSTSVNHISDSTQQATMNKDGISTAIGTTSNPQKMGSRSSVQNANHPLYNTKGFWSGNYGVSNESEVIPADWAALYSTDDDNAYTLWLKCEQSEAGFGYVDAYNRFRHYSRAVIDNDVWAPKVTFASDGSGVSYNSINVTNGWERVVKGVRIDNLWSSNVTSVYNLRDWEDSLTDDATYIKASALNRDGTSALNYLNNSQITSPIKNYDWLPYSAPEVKYSWAKYAKTNAGGFNYIYDVNTRDWDVENLSSTSYFQGEETVNGNNQLTLNTNYAWNINCEPGGYVRDRNNTRTDFTNQMFLMQTNNVFDRQAELATEVLANYSTPQTDIRSISFSVHEQDLTDIKTLDIFDRITIDHNESGLVINKDYAIMGITHTITPNSWDVTYQLWNQEGRP